MTTRYKECPYPTIDILLFLLLTKSISYWIVPTLTLGSQTVRIRHIMKFFQIVFGLAAAVSAINIYLYLEDNICEHYNVAFVCTGVNPNVCCWYKSPIKSVGFQAIPNDWTLNLGAYRETDCTGLVHAVQISSRSDYCFTADDFGFGKKGYHSGDYDFSSRKRTLEIDNAAKECTSVRPNAMMFPDGAMFNLTGLDDESFEELVR